MFRRIEERLRAYAERKGRGYPDWAVRYLPVVRWLGTVPATGSCIIEIGANENGLARFTGAHVIAVDRSFQNLVAARAVQPILPVVSDINALPFREKACDVCVCMDTFEHLPGPRRNGALAEISRILASTGRAVIGFPSGKASARAEARVSEAYREYTGRRIVWLEEHSEEGLPSTPVLLTGLMGHLPETHGIEVRKNANLVLWEWMWMILMGNLGGRLNSLFQVLLYWLTPLLSRFHSGVCYRTLFFVAPRDMP